jgi:myo-inositol-1(or 4)-monophosphatase
MHIISELMSKTYGLRRMGSAAVDLAYVACGRSEGYFECQLNPWDIAAGLLLVKEAGGLFTDFEGDGQVLFKGEVVAANPVIHPQIMEIIKKYWNESV